MMCEDLQKVLLDDDATLREDAKAHLVGCSACRELFRVHRAALALTTNDEVPTLTAPDVFSELQRRRTRRVVRGAAGLSAACAVVLWIVASPGGPGGQAAPVTEAPLVATDVPYGHPESTSLTVAPDAHRQEDAPEFSDDGGLLGLAQLVSQVRGYTQRDLSTSDRTYAPFGELPQWVALSHPMPLGSPVYRNALGPLLNHSPEVLP